MAQRVFEGQGKAIPFFHKDRPDLGDREFRVGVVIPLKGHGIKDDGLDLMMNQSRHGIGQIGIERRIQALILAIMLGECAADCPDMMSRKILRTVDNALQSIDCHDAGDRGGDVGHHADTEGQPDTGQDFSERARQTLVGALSGHGDRHDMVERFGQSVGPVGVEFLVPIPFGYRQKHGEEEDDADADSKDLEVSALAQTVPEFDPRDSPPLIDHDLHPSLEIRLGKFYDFFPLLRDRDITKAHIDLVLGSGLEKIVDTLERYILNRDTEIGAHFLPEIDTEPRIVSLLRGEAKRFVDVNSDAELFRQGKRRLEWCRRGEGNIGRLCRNAGQADQQSREEEKKRMLHE